MAQRAFRADSRQLGQNLFWRYFRVAGNPTGTLNSVGLSVVISKLIGDLVPAGNPGYKVVSEDLSIRMCVYRLG